MSVQILAGSDDITKLAPPDLKNCFVAPIFEAMVKEVRLQVAPEVSLKFEESSFVLIRTDGIEFKLMLSNLIHHSEQAMLRVLSGINAQCAAKNIPINKKPFYNST